VAINKGTPTDIALQGLNNPDDVLSLALQGFLETDLAIFGDITIGGEATISITRNLQSTGIINLEGEAGLEATLNHNSTGALNLNGSSTTRRIFGYQSTGIIALSGNGTIDTTITPTEPATIVLGGTTQISVTRNLASSGNVIISGDAANARTFAYVSSGLVIIAGDTAIEFIPEDFAIDSSGGVVIGGEAIVSATVTTSNQRPGGAGSIAAHAYALSVRMHDEEIYRDYIERLELARERQKKKFSRTYTNKSTGSVKVSGEAKVTSSTNKTDDYLVDYTECKEIDDIILTEDAMLISGDLVGGVYADGVVRHTPIDTVMKVTKRREVINNIIRLEDIDLVGGGILSQDDRDENELYELDLVS
jgi:hypothetical protein